MKLDTAIRDFLLFLKHEQGATFTTSKQYQAYLHHFHHWIETNGGNHVPSVFWLPVKDRTAT